MELATHRNGHLVAKWLDAFHDVLRARLKVAENQSLVDDAGFGAAHERGQLYVGIAKAKLALREYELRQLTVQLALDRD